MDKNPLAHAEMLVIQQASHILQQKRLVDCDLYVTLEPCTMCAGAIAHARFRRIIFGAYDIKGGGVCHGCKVFEQSTVHHSPEIIGGVSELECKALLQDFFKQLR